MKAKHIISIILGLLLITHLSGCSIGSSSKDGGPKRNVDVSKIPNATPKVEARSKYGNPNYYYANGKKQYVMKSSRGYTKVGLASWYGTKFHGQLTSSREPYNMYSMTAASRDLPIPTYVRVTNLENGKSVIVKVNDRGPFVGNRIIDLSYAAAKKLGYANHGTAMVRVTAIDPVQWASGNNYEAASPQPTKLAQSNSSNHYYLQVGAFSERRNAELFRDRVAQLTQAPVYIKATSNQQNTIYRVQVGPLLASESNQVREHLQANGINQPISVVG